jgi:hypothetical protein
MQAAINIFAKNGVAALCLKLEQYPLHNIKCELSPLAIRFEDRESLNFCLEG